MGRAHALVQLAAPSVPLILPGGSQVVPVPRHAGVGAGAGAAPPLLSPSGTVISPLPIVHSPLPFLPPPPCLPFPLSIFFCFLLLPFFLLLLFSMPLLAVLALGFPGVQRTLSLPFALLGGWGLGSAWSDLGLVWGMSRLAASGVSSGDGASGSGGMGSGAQRIVSC